jgi:ankyrin repeat protein
VDTILHHAVYNGKLEVISTLLVAGENVDVSDNDGWTPLHYAVWEGKLEVIPMLLATGANVNECFKAWGAWDSMGWTPLFYAVDRNNIELVEIMLAVGANVNATGNDGLTALHLAGREANVKVIEMLLEAGANVNATDNATDTDGWTPLHHAVCNATLEAIQTRCWRLVRMSTSQTSVEKHLCTLQLRKASWRRSRCC